MGLMGDFGERVEAEAARVHVRNVTRRSGSSFLWAMRCLDRERREAMYAIYAFCREVDDIADGMEAAETKLEKLQAWRHRIAMVFGDGATIDTGRALQGVVHRYGLDQQDFELIIQGMETDAQPVVHLQTGADLDEYMDRVACSVGRISNAVFGIREPQGSALAKSLGEALQLTNILRDLDEDAVRGRTYIPAELAEKHGTLPLNMSLPSDQTTIARACEELAHRASSQFLNAQAILKDIDGPASRPGTLMMHTYWLVFRKLKERGWMPPRVSVKPTLAERLWILLRFGFR